MKNYFFYNFANMLKDYYEKLYNKKIKRMYIITYTIYNDKNNILRNVVEKILKENGYSPFATTCYIKYIYEISYYGQKENLSIIEKAVIENKIKQHILKNIEKKLVRKNIDTKNIKKIELQAIIN